MIYKAFNLWQSNQDCNLAFSYLQFEYGLGNKAKPTVSDIRLWFPDCTASLPCRGEKQACSYATHVNVVGFLVCSWQADDDFIETK